MKTLSRRKKVLFAVVTVVLVFGVLEVGARAWYFAEGRWFAAKSDDVSPGDPRINRLEPLRYDFAPGARLQVGGALATINNVGLRGGDVTEPKKRTRVLCLGDSCTFGFGPDVTDDKTYPATLGRFLDQEAAEPFEVLNAGRPNYGTLDCLNFFLYKGVELQPDYVIILCGWNDAHHHHLLGRSVPQSSSPLERSAFYRLVREKVSARSSARDSDNSLEVLKTLPPATDGLSEEAFARTERVFEELVRCCRTHGATPVLITLPNFTKPDWTDLQSLSDQEARVMAHHLVHYNLSPRGWYQYVSRVNSLIAAVAQRQQVPLVDGSTISDPDHFTDVAHLNAKGNTKLATRVVAAFLKYHSQRKT